jgi:hypothetical protein
MLNIFVFVTVGVVYYAHMNGGTEDEQCTVIGQDPQDR